MFIKNELKIDEDLKFLSLKSYTKNKNEKIAGKQLKIPIFEVYNNLTSIKGSNKGNIELVEINSKIVLLILL
jgi:hypothetical protein